jgi:hypothetical protein
MSRAGGIPAVHGGEDVKRRKLPSEERIIDVHAPALMPRITTPDRSASANRTPRRSTPMNSGRVAARLMRHAPRRLPAGFTLRDNSGVGVSGTRYQESTKGLDQ